MSVLPSKRLESLEEFHTQVEGWCKELYELRKQNAEAQVEIKELKCKLQTRDDVLKAQWHQDRDKFHTDFDELKEKFNALCVETVRLTKEMDKRAERIPSRNGQPPMWKPVSRDSSQAARLRKENESLREKLNAIQKTLKGM